MSIVLLSGVSTANGSDDSVTREYPHSGVKLLPIHQLQETDNSWLVFSAFREGNWDIYRWDWDASHPPLRMTNTPFDESAPSLAANHSICVYESVDGRLWRADIDGSKPPVALPFGSDEKLDMHPSVSPDGDRVVMSTSLDRKSDDCDLIVFGIRASQFGRRMEMLAFQHYPNWAPDGTHIAFSNLHGRLQTGGPIYEIWMTRSDEPWARQLTMLDGISVSPSWSPDGRLVAFSSDHAGQFDIWVVDVVTRSYRRLTTHEAADSDPVFSPDGKSIVFESTRDGEPQLYKIAITGGAVVKVEPFGVGNAIPCRDPDWK